MKTTRHLDDVGVEVAPSAEAQAGALDSPTRPLSPKRPQTTETAGLADIFPYYAGFSFEWASRTLLEHRHKDAGVVLDPWNGSGTTTAAASFNNIPSVGIDLNPVANIVAQLRAASQNLQVVKLNSRKPSEIGENEPLLAWFDEKTARHLRNWHDVTLGQDAATRSLVLVAIFRVVRTLTRKFQGSNPTWVRRVSETRAPVYVDPRRISSLIIKEQRSIAERIQAESKGRSKVAILEASSGQLPIADESIGTVLTSPPYLTRIDYAVAYSRELAVLGINIQADRTLRNQLMGTTLIRAEDSRQTEFEGSVARSLVKSVSEHESHASGVYYLKQVCQYLSDLTQGFDEITRVCKPGAKAIFVVQDSYYKDIPVQLADICEEEAQIRGWTLAKRHPFEVTRSLTSLNKAARNYTKGTVNETVIILKRDAT